MKRIGVISTTLVMERSTFFKEAKPKIQDNEFGRAAVYLADGIALILRHGDDPNHHILPHMINHRANMKALKEIGASEVIGINSTGSLKKELSPGTIVIPDDFLTLTATPTIFQDSVVHITPSLNETIRQKLIKAANNCSIPVVTKATYWQTHGPRLETKAEIKMMANFADIVGMTMANEAVIAMELGIPYASACSVDNYGHGLLEKPLSLEEIL
ncbi:MAG TPA: MTAP family purine nucleoside phosphorylase, partial [Smithellaceae bacterium]|nr:MTAP family purine nucleoside phosphorylase [Smithellaceae bacterium]